MSSPIPSPSPSKSFRSRMGTVMRRTSTVLSLSNSRPGTPTQDGLARRASSSSIGSSGNIVTSPPSIETPSITSPPAPASAIRPSEHLLPSPIAESPIREQRALSEETDALRRRSILAEVAGPAPGAFTDEPESVEELPKNDEADGKAVQDGEQVKDTESIREPTQEPAKDQDAQITEHQVAENPGEQDSHQSKEEAVPEKFLAQSRDEEQTPASPVQEVAETIPQSPPEESFTAEGNQTAFDDLHKPAPGAFTDPFPEAVSAAPRPASPKPDHAIDPVTSVPTSPGVAADEQHERSFISYFEAGGPTIPATTGTNGIEFHKVVEETQQLSPPQEYKPAPAGIPMPEPEPRYEPQVIAPSLSSARSISEGSSSGQSIPVHHVQPQYAFGAPLAPAPVAASYDLGLGNHADVWSLDALHRDQGAHYDQHTHQPHHEDLDDPFADPPTFPVASALPVTPKRKAEDIEATIPSRNSTPTPTPRTQPRSLGNSSVPHILVERETDETLPLLHPRRAHDYSAFSNSTYNPGSNPIYHVSPNGHSASDEPKLHSAGWLEYIGRHKHTYYVHPTQRLVTDLDLRNEQILDAVMQQARERGSELHIERDEEVWISSIDRKVNGGKNGKKGKGKCQADWEWKIARINHTLRALTFASAKGANASSRDVQWESVTYGARKGKIVPRHAHSQEDLELEEEIRYWKWMSDHPGHVQLPRKAREEALEALGWTLSDQLVSKPAHGPAFTTQQSQDLIAFLQSTSGALDNESIHTRTIAGIHVRLLEASQPSFHHSGTTWTAGKVLVCICCLGMPLLFMPRRHPSPTVPLYGDEERGHGYNGYSTARKALLTNLCVCIFSAVMITLSTVFLIAINPIERDPRDHNEPRWGAPRVLGIISSLLSGLSILVTVILAISSFSSINSQMGFAGEGLQYTGLQTDQIIEAFPSALLLYSIISYASGVFITREDRLQGIQFGLGAGAFGVLVGFGLTLAFIGLA